MSSQSCGPTDEGQQDCLRHTRQALELEDMVGSWILVCYHASYYKTGGTVHNRYSRESCAQILTVREDSIWLCFRAYDSTYTLSCACTPSSGSPNTSFFLTFTDPSFLAGSVPKGVTTYRLYQVAIFDDIMVLYHDGVYWSETINLVNMDSAHSPCSFCQ